MKARIFFTNFWGKGETEELQPTSRYLYLYLSTNMRINLLGLYFIPDRVITFESGLKEDGLRKSKEELEASGYAYFIKGWAYIPRAQELGGYFNERLEPAVEKELTDIPKEIIEHFTSKGYEIPYRHPIDGHRKQKPESRSYKKEDKNISSNDDINLDDFKI